MREDGVRGLLGNGRLASQMLRDVPYAIATLLSYEILQGYVSKKFKGKKVKDALCGALAGGFGAFVTTPFDLIKTRMMMGGEYTSILNAVGRISKEEGLSAFMIGMGPRLMHKIPANGVFFLFYETFKSLLGVTS
jgi:Mitochondrial carrier protein